MSNKIKYTLGLIRNVFVGKPRFKQELLLRLALREKGFDLEKMIIKIDHICGFNYVNSIKLGIKYPDSFYDEARKLIPNEKVYDFYFNGNMDKEGQRAMMLQAFQNMPNSVIIESNEGRIQQKKDKFNYKYFSEFAKSKFGLCPHQADWHGDKDYMWTYRFIEACFVEAIPILFKKAPLGQEFINGFYFFLDTDINNGFVYDLEIASKNRSLAKEKFCLSEEECSLIQDTL